VTGVESRSRLEQLEALQRRTKHQLDQARVAGDLVKADKLHRLNERLAGEIEALRPTPAPPAGQPRGKRQKAEDRVGRRLEQLGVTAHDVRVWALEVGLIDRIRRGRIKGELVEAYAAAQQDVT
jgi:hypothetical protein